MRAVVLSGEGPSFCAGLDFKSFISGDGDLAGDGFAAPRAASSPTSPSGSPTAGASCAVPVIAALRGACLGGGLQIALAADIRIAAPDARISVMEIRYGLVPDMSLSQTLPSLVRDDVARELAYTGRIVEADEALELGLVTRIDDDPSPPRGRWRPRSRPAPRTRSAGQAARQRGPEASAAEGLALEASLQRELLGTPNQAAAAGRRSTKQPAEFADPD